MKTNNTIIWISAVVLIIIGGLLGWFLKSTFTPDCPQITSGTTIQQDKDTTHFNYKPIIIYQDTGRIILKDSIILKHDTIKSKSDSIKIYKAFFEIINDSVLLVNDSSLYCFLRYQITQNKLLTVEGKYVNKKPTTIINNSIVNPPRNQLYIGGSTGTDFNNSFLLEARINLKTKSDNIWGIGIEYLPGISKKIIYKISHDIKIKL